MRLNMNQDFSTVWLLAASRRSYHRAQHHQGLMSECVQDIRLIAGLEASCNWSQRPLHTNSALTHVEPDHNQAQSEVTSAQLHDCFNTSERASQAGRERGRRGHVKRSLTYSKQFP